jgi:hypothetical protein
MRKLKPVEMAEVEGALMVTLLQQVAARVVFEKRHIRRYLKVSWRVRGITSNVWRD